MFGLLKQDDEIDLSGYIYSTQRIVPSAGRMYKLGATELPIDRPWALQKERHS